MSKRILFFPVAVVMMFLLLGLRLVDLQVVQGVEFRQVSENNRFFTRPVPADRGVFFDRLGQQLVYNKPAYYLLDSPNKLYSQRTLIPSEQALSLIAESPEQVLSTQYRDYQAPVALSSVIGYVGAVSKEDLQNNKELKPQQSIGKTGLERVFDKELRGMEGSVLYETNARGEIIREVSRRSAIAGNNLNLSLDLQLNHKALELLQGKKGVVIVGDPNNGEMLALVSHPSFDANLFTHPRFSEQEQLEQRQQIQDSFSDERQLFFNHAVAGAYPPGSVFKLVTAIAGLELGSFDRDTTVVDTGVLKVDEYQFGNWYYRQYGGVEGEISLVRAISRSNDIYFYKAAEWIGPERLAEVARLLGFGQKTNIELPTEAAGTVPDPAWKEKAIGERWYLGNTYHFGIGQGDLLVTPLQVFKMTSLFANQGKVCSPTLIKGNTTTCQELSFSDEHLDTVIEGMVNACSQGGTAFPFFPWNQERTNKVACKTGTAEFGAANEDGHRKTHGWFTAIIELDNIETKDYPRKLVVTVLVESDDQVPFREGSADAAPLALDLAHWIEENR